MELHQLQALLAQGRFAEAYDAAEQGLGLYPDDITLMVARANAAIGMRAPEQIIAALRPVIDRRPHNRVLKQRLAGALNLRGCQRSRDGQWATAREDFLAALDEDPQQPQAWFNLALALRAMEQPVQAIDALQRHLALSPADDQASLVLASLQSADQARAQLSRLDGNSEALDQGWLAYTAIRAGLTDQCTHALSRLNRDSNYPAAQDALTELRLRGEVDAIVRCAPRLIAVGREAGRTTARSELIEKLALPAVYRSESDLAAHRERFDAGLAELEQHWTALDGSAPKPSLNDLSHSNFLLAYQGRNDRDLQLRYARLLSLAVQTHHPEFSVPPTSRHGRRVGLLSSCWRNCTAGHYFAGWIEWLKRMGLEVFLYQLGPQRDQETDQLAASASQFQFLSGRLESIAERIREDRLDLLIYPEIGMDARLLPLLACRLSARTAVGWGHPITTGFKHVDAYFSCAAMEPEAAQDHYVEPLHLLDGLGVDYRRSKVPKRADRAALGLPPDVPTVLIPQSLFKLHPAFDPMMAKLAAAEPEVVFILFASEYPEWQQGYLERLNHSFAAQQVDITGRTRFLPQASRDTYLQINQACDLMLDSLYWSGGNTAIDALQAGLPVVTCAGPFMRSRQTQAMLERIDLHSELACATPDLAVQRCVELLQNVEQRRQLSQTILERQDALFESAGAEQSFRRHIETLLAKQGG